MVGLANKQMCTPNPISIDHYIIDYSKFLTRWQVYIHTWHSRNMVFALRHDVTRVALEAPQNKEHLEQARIVLKNLDYLTGKMRN